MPISPLNELDAFISLDRSRVLGYVTAMIDRYWREFDQARPDQPAVDDSMRALLRAALPETPIDAIEALDDADHVLDKSLSQPRPRYFAFVGSSGLEMGVLADVLAACHDINLAVYSGAASLVEDLALNWIADFIGFPGRGGAFTSGGMLSNLTALTAAREHALPGARFNGVTVPTALYISRDAHSSVDRAAEVLGLGSRSIRDIPLDAERRMDVPALRAAVEADVAAGITPIAIVANAGTTLAGAVDPISEIAAIAREHGIWLHVDGAYGMPAAATALARDQFAGLDMVDSITIDAHKWLFLPKPCGVLLIHNQEALRTAFSHDATYIPKEESEEMEMLNPVDWTLEYSRPLRALKVWLAFRTYGASAFRDAITRNIEQARLCAQLVRQTPTLELLLDPQLSVVLFRRIPTRPGIDVNAHNRALLRAIQNDGRVYVSGAVVDGASYLRSCFVNYRTRNEDVEALIEVVEDLGARLEAQHG